MESAADDALLDTLPVGIVVVDGDLRISAFNRGASRITGFRKKEMIGQQWSDALQGCSTELQAALDASVAKCGGTTQIETNLPTRSGTMVSVRMSIDTPGNEAGRPARSVLVFQDISRLTARERERTKLLSLVTHDLKSSVSILGGFVKLLLKKINRLNREKTIANLNTMWNELSKMEAMTSEFLECAQLEESGIEQKEVSPGQELQQLAASFAPACRERTIRIDLQVPDSLPPVRGDAIKLNRAFANLMTNAMKYSPAGGTITIAAEESPRDIMVRFIDDGKGIDPEEATTIFDFFEQGPGSHKKHGFGLGLAVVKTVIEQHNGCIDVCRAPGRGTQFTITMPRALQR